MKKFELTVITPERTTYEGLVGSLLLPAWEGALGVLAGHAPALILLKEGVARTRDAQGREEILSLSGGFAEITPEKVTLFAETAEMGLEIDEERARLAIERAKESILKFRRHEKGAEEIDIEKARASLRRALTRLRVAQYLTRAPRRAPPNERSNLKT